MVHPGTKIQRNIGEHDNFPKHSGYHEIVNFWEGKHLYDFVLPPDTSLLLVRYLVLLGRSNLASTTFVSYTLCNNLQAEASVFWGGANGEKSSKEAKAAEQLPTCLIRRAGDFCAAQASSSISSDTKSPGNVWKLPQRTYAFSFRT